MSARIRLLGATLAAGLLLSACGSGDADDTGDAEAWSYKSGDGKTYTADGTPKRIIAQGEAAAALISFGIKPVGIYSSDPVETNASLKNLDLTGIEILGETWGEIDVEKAAALKPDLIVSAYWPAEKAYGGLENGVQEGSKKVAELADVVGPAMGDSTVGVVEGFEELAETLGADLDAPSVAKDKEAFEAARDRFKATVAGKDGLTTMAVSPAEDLLYVAVPEHASELMDFRSWGLDVLIPNDPDKDFPYWENLSWENADKYQPDMVLFDDRTYDASMATAEKQPTWKQIKAVEAGQVVSWPAFWMHTYQDYAEQLDLLSDAIEKIDPSLT